MGLRFAFLAALAAGVALLCLYSGAHAGVVGSPHDFSGKSFVTSGACSACHIPHGAWTNTLWSRNLDDYVTNLDTDGSGTYQVNYVHPPTIPCYDCHDSHTPGNIDDDPTSNSANFGSYPPQDIAFGGDGPQGIPGYYENNPPYPFNYGADPNTNPADNTTGGHYLKYYTGTDPFRKGDKLPCRDCHNPHAWSDTPNWQARASQPVHDVYGRRPWNPRQPGKPQNLCPLPRLLLEQPGQHGRIACDLQRNQLSIQ
jgi:hypothetical protein